MNIFKIVMISAFCLYALVYFILLIRTKKPFKTMFAFAFLGVFVTVLINLTSIITGVSVPINPFSAVFIFSFGVPGVIALLFFSLIFI